jgi:hypothetical protein
MDFDDIYGLEDWEDDKILYEKEDWVGLLKLRKERARKQPSDLYAQQRLAEILNINKQYKKTLDLITPIYQKNYKSGFGIHEIIDALYGLGKSENDFNWITKLNILKLDSETMELCVDFLKPQRKARNVLEIYGELIMNADYCAFNEERLADFLVNHPEKFEIKKDSEYFWDIELKIKRK